MSDIEHSLILETQYQLVSVGTLAYLGFGANLSLSVFLSSCLFTFLSLSPCPLQKSRHTSFMVASKKLMLTGLLKDEAWNWHRISFTLLLCTCDCIASHRPSPDSRGEDHTRPRVVGSVNSWYIGGHYCNRLPNHIIYVFFLKVLK